MASIGLWVGDSAALTANDISIRDRLVGWGHTVTYRDELVTPTLALGHDGCVLAESCTGDVDEAAFFSLALPWLSMDIGSWDETGISSVSSDNSALSSRFFDLVAHDITAGITPLSNCQVKNTNAGMWGTPGSPGNLAPDAFVFAWHTNSATHAMGVCIEQGDLLVGNVPAPARRVGLGYIDSMTNPWVPDLTAAGQQLFDQAVDWMLAGGGPDPITGTAVITQASQTVAATGKLGYAGTAVIGQASQTVAASGVVSAPSTMGTAAITQANQTVAVIGQLGYAGAAAITQTGDAIAAVGALGYTGTAAVVQADDVANASGFTGGAVPAAIITGTVSGPARVEQAVTGPELARITTGPALARAITGPAFGVDDTTGPAVITDPKPTGPALSRVVTGPGLSRTLTGAGR